jgi:putative Mg2+ transporter-C (MgtC) family protein
MAIDWEVLLKLFLAVLFGGIIGYERESAHRPAGLRTNILVCLGSTLLVSFELYYHSKNPSISDHLRMAAQIVTGIGFLGAGTIIHVRSDVKGLTTAATIWVTAAIGIAIGGGFYYAAIASVLLALLCLRLFKIFEHHFTIKSGRILIISGESKGNFSEKLNEVLKRRKISIWDIKISVDIDRILEASVRIPAHVDIDSLIEDVMKIDGVHKVSTELLLG